MSTYYRRRAMALILNRGGLHASRLLAGRDDLAVFRRILWTCLLRASRRLEVLIRALEKSEPSPREGERVG